MRLTTTPQYRSRTLATLTRDDCAEDYLVPVDVRGHCADGCTCSAHGLAHVVAELHLGEVIPVSDVDGEGNCLMIGYLGTSTITPDLDPTGLPGDEDNGDEDGGDEDGGDEDTGDGDDGDNEFDNDGFFDHQREHEDEDEDEHEHEHEHHHHHRDDDERPKEDAGGPEKISPRQSARVVRPVNTPDDHSRGDDSPVRGLFAAVALHRARRERSAPAWWPEEESISR